MASTTAVNDTTVCTQPTNRHPTADWHGHCRACTLLANTPPGSTLFPSFDIYAPLCIIHCQCSVLQVKFIRVCVCVCARQLNWFIIQPLQMSGHGVCTFTNRRLRCCVCVRVDNVRTQAVCASSNPSMISSAANWLHKHTRAVRTLMPSYR